MVQDPICMFEKFVIELQKAKTIDNDKTYDGIILFIGGLFSFETGSINSNLLACFNLISIHTVFDGISLFVLFVLFNRGSYSLWQES